MQIGFNAPATGPLIDPDSPGMRPCGSIEGEAELFTGGDSDGVGDIGNMHRFRDATLSKLA